MCPSFIYPSSVKSLKITSHWLSKVDSPQIANPQICRQFAGEDLIFFVVVIFGFAICEDNFFDYLKLPKIRKDIIIFLNILTQNDLGQIVLNKKKFAKRTCGRIFAMNGLERS
jgi:hypothetical protein